MSFIDELKVQLGTLDGVDLKKLEASYQEDIGGLKDKNAQLLGKMNVLKEKAGGVDLEDYNRLKNNAAKTAIEIENAEIEDAKKSQNYDFIVQKEKERLSTATERWKGERDGLQEEISGITTRYHQKLTTIALDTSLRKVGVSDKFLKYVKSSFASKAVVELDDNGVEAVFIKDNPTAIPLPINDYISKWSTSEDAKNVISAMTSSGGGANGSGATGTSQLQQLEEAYSKAVSVDRDAKAAMILQGKINAIKKNSR